MQGLLGLILVSTMCLTETEEVPHLIPTVERKTGENVTFSCQWPKDHRFFQWYKQSPGKMVQTVGAGVYGGITQQYPFNNTRFQFRKEDDEIFLTISSVNKEDEAVYFCQSGTEFLQTFNNGFFLLIKDCNRQTSVYVEQTPDATRLQSGDTMSLQCSLVYSNNESGTQCPKKNSVYWFKAASGSSYPSILYTARSSTEDALKRSCFYHLSKTLEDSSDFGTYYCAVVICGEILLGDGSKLETTKPDPSVLVVGGVLVCCVVVIVCLLFYILGRRVSGSSGGVRGSPNAEHDTLTPCRSKDLGKGENLTYAAALDFSATNMRHGKKVNGNTECVYSSVRPDSLKQQRL